MTQRVILLDIAAVVILAIVLLSHFTRRMTRGSENRFFICLAAVTLLSGCLDISADILDNLALDSFFARRLMHSVQMMVYNTTTPCYLMYVMSLTNVWHRLRHHKPLWIMLMLPYLADMSLLLVNIFNGCILDYSGGVYTVKPGAYFTYAVAGMYLLVALFYIIFYHKLFTPTQIVGLLCQAPLAIVSAIAIPLIPNICVTTFSGAVGMMLMSVLIQRPENLVDSFTGLRKYSAYADDMKKYYMTHSPVTVILVNISNYDSIKNIIGYDQSNILLRHIGKAILEQDRTAKCHGLCYYLDRGRFRLVINSFYRGTANNVAELINAKLKENLKVNQYYLNLITHVCVAQCPEDIPDFRSLIAFGVEFHRQLPFNGEVVHADSGSVQKIINLLTGMDSIIDRAFANHGFHVYYQPIYSVEKKRFVSAEALLRLVDDKEGFVSPEIFIPAAEKSGAIHKIGDYVLNEVFKFIASPEYRKLGLEYIEINLSVSQCMNHGLADNILELMSRYGVTSNQINLEITETAASYDQSVMTENLTQLSNAGLTFSLDDYGTGYSNMYRIAALPLKIVKLDKTFVNNQNSKMWTILQNTVRMIKDLNMEIVVEGIETEDMVNKFSDLKCDFIQGYFFSKPIPQREFVEFIDRWNNRTRVNT